MWNGAFIWNFHWAACGAQFWNGLSLFKNDKMADGSPGRRYVSHSHFNGANFCWEGKGHFGSSGEQIWKSIWDEHKIIAWSYWSYIRAEWLSKYSIRWCYFCLGGSCRNIAPPPPPDGPHGKTFNLYRLLRFSPCVCKVLPEYAICRSNRNIFTCHG